VVTRDRVALAVREATDIRDTSRLGLTFEVQVQLPPPALP
jgi:hypothetical protein